MGNGRGDKPRVKEHVDLLIVGGGPVGAALALALRDSGLSIALLEAQPDFASVDDVRTLALSYGSRNILHRLGVWGDALSATAIESIHVSQRGRLGRTRLSAQEAGVPALGYVVRYATLAQRLRAALTGSAVDFHAGARVVGIQATAHYALVEYQFGAALRQMTASLVALADGGHGLAALTGSYADEKDYRQSAVVAWVESELPHGNVAYERFTPDGPCALLPDQDRFALVWVTDPQSAGELIAAPEGEFLAQLHAHFGDRVGRFLATGARSAFALKLRTARSPRTRRVALVGNASQALHPVAGQGFNLGLRDAWDLQSEIRETAPGALGDAAMLARYLRRRAWDRRIAIGITDTLVRVFSNDRPMLRSVRGLALTALDVSPVGRRWLSRQMIFGARR
jgi:2-octaprenyl-6-methoxyphenol hydroxylase